MDREAEGQLRDIARLMAGGEPWDGKMLPPEWSEALEGLRILERIAEVGRAQRLAIAELTHEQGRAVGQGNPMAGLGSGAATGRWGPLRILEKIGEGSYGEVFRARDPALQVDVALKLWFPRWSVGTSADQILREARTLARIRHPNVLTVLGAASHGGRVGMWSQLLRGETLEASLARHGSFGAHEAALIGAELCRALAAVHTLGLVHRDVKTRNVMRAEGGQTILMDFGSVAHTHRSAALHREPSQAGTPLSMAPEQLLGGRVGPRTDLYGLSVLLYRLVSGSYPIEASSIETLIERHRRRDFTPLRDRRPDLPVELIRIVEHNLAHNPRDRSASAGVFERELIDFLAGVSSESPRPSPDLRPERSVGVPSAPAKTARALAITVAALLALIVVGLGLWRSRGVIHSVAAKKAWILVAEFSGPPDDPGVATALHDLVSAALDQSGIVATVPQDQIRIALQRSGRPPETKVTSTLAQEIAYRSSVRSVLEGRVSRLGQGYSIVLRVVDVENPGAVLVQSGVARSERALVATIGRLSQRLREGLGEKRDAVQASRMLVDAMTPSFEAFRLFERARDLNYTDDPFESRNLCRAALALDPDFAMAWYQLGVTYWNLAHPESTAMAFREALRRPLRLTETGRLRLEARMAELRNDVPAALAAYDRLLRLDPSDVLGHVNRGNFLRDIGRTADALEEADKAISLCPFGPPFDVLVDKWGALADAGRWREADRLASMQEDNSTWVCPRLEYAIALENWARAESLATAALADPRLSTGYYGFVFHVALAGVRVAQGALDDARHELREAHAAALEDDDPLSASLAVRNRLLLEVACGVRPGALDPRVVRDRSMPALLTRGLWAAASGDTAEARRTLHTLRSRSDPDVAWHGAGPRLIEAWIDAQAGRWSRIVDRLAATARIGRDGGVQDPVGPMEQRWLLAEAWDHLGRPDSAAALLDSPLPRWFTLPGSAVAVPFAHRRLVLLYARQGRLADARRHWDAFSKPFIHLDPAMKPLVEEARAALASGEVVVHRGGR